MKKKKNFKMKMESFTLRDDTLALLTLNSLKLNLDSLMITKKT